MSRLVEGSRPLVLAFMILLLLGTPARAGPLTDARVVPRPAEPDSPARRIASSRIDLLCNEYSPSWIRGRAGATEEVL